MEKLYKIFSNKYLLYGILFFIMFGTSGDLNLNILRYATFITLICYMLISEYNIRMGKKDVKDNDVSNFYLSGESYKTEYIIITCIYLSAIYAILKITILS